MRSRLLECPKCRIKKRYIVGKESTVITRCKYCSCKITVTRMGAKEYAIN